MKLTEGLYESWDMIRHNKLRTFLTMLGMNIGVAAVIAVMATGLMGRSAVMEGVESIGTTLLWVRPNNDAYQDRAERVFMKPQDLYSMEELLPDAEFSPLLRGSRLIGYGGYQEGGSIYGVWAAYPRFWNARVARGRFLSEQDVAERRKVIVLGSNTARTFFGETADSLGRVIRIGSQGFTVVGVMAPRERSAVSDGGDNDTSYVPYETFQSMYDWSRYGGPRVLRLYLKAPSVEALNGTVSVVERYLYSQYGNHDGEPRFLVNKAEENISTFNSIFGIITTVIALIAGISLLVGGIGIMNIMLVTVTERTKEIGIRKAIGAKRGDILLQFLVEAVIICLIGGGLGIFLGIAISLVVSAVQQWQYVMPLLAMIVGLVVSLSIGLFFGIYPAVKAARLDPVVALTKE
jgi:putative ABC transport system permease protein